jgi:hypothetical protein
MGIKKKRSDKFDQNTSKEGMGTVDKNSSEEKGINTGKKKKNNNSGEGIEEFIDDKANLSDGDVDET